MATRNEVYQKFGITSEAAQLFETDLGTFLMAVEGLFLRWHIEHDIPAASQFAESIDAQTLGGLLRKVKVCQITVDNQIEQIFDSALKARNKLTHGFFERHNLRIQTDDGRDHMIADLEKMHTELFAAWQVAQRLSSAMVEALVKTKLKTN